MYPQFLRKELPPLLEKFPLNLRDAMFIVHDGTPDHFGRIIRKYPEQIYPNWLIGSEGPQSWPLKSPVLNSLDSFLWGHLKTLISSGKLFSMTFRVQVR